MANETTSGWDTLRLRYPWPEVQPKVPPHRNQGWLNNDTAYFLRESVNAGATVLELGTWLGKSTRFILNLHPSVRVACIDWWKGSPELNGSEYATLLPVLYETFLNRSWDYRDRIVPVRETTETGMLIAFRAGLRPDVVYIDANHTRDCVRRDVLATRELFPNARVVGDDYGAYGVGVAVDELVAEGLVEVETRERSWRLIKWR